MPTVAVVSDTHGKVDPLLDRLFAGATWLLHAGDVCDGATLERIRALAPEARFVAVRGNNDDLPLPEVAVVDIGRVAVLVCHREVDAEEALADHARARIVVVGHSHRGQVDVRDGRLWLNPGGAGPKRFKLLRSAARLEIDRARATARLHSLEDPDLPVVAEATLELRA